ncbi:MAG: D-ribose ABC transporter substrate-binding protein [Brachybacterium tyrofermentans]|uniref:D-ribose ABC transporter substrate-binding protein n=1 Tax=Brachybacterium tyrofermentans TaxID=47848 RepID=UPI003FB7762F
MERRHFLSALGIGAAAAGLAACSGSSDDAGGGSGGGSSDGGSDGGGGGTDGGLITIIVNDPSNPYWKIEGDVAAAKAEELGYTTTIGAHKGDTNTENTLVDTAISNKSVALIMDPANADGSIGTIKKAIQAEIPVFLINAEINEAGLVKAQLVSNNAQGAALGAQEWVARMEEKGQYVELFGLPSDNNAQTRSNGFTTTISQYPDLEKVGEEVADWDRTKGHDKAQSLLQANPDITGLISGNDEMALGAIAAFKEAGALEGIVVGGFDGSPDAIEAIKNGELAYTVLQPVATFAELVIEMADDLLRNGTEPETEKQALDCILVTEDNVDKMTAPFTYTE